MKKFLNNIKQEASHIRMSAGEKAAMRAQLFGMPSPLAPSKVEGYFFFSYQFRMALAGLMLFVLAGAGTASAAAGSLPGDLLYPVKIKINEPVKVALASTPAAKAEVHIRLADVRVEEAQALAAQGRLDEDTADLLSQDFDLHAAGALALAGDEQEQPEVQTLAVEAPAAPAPEARGKAAPVQTMMMSTFAAPEPEDSASSDTELEASTTEKQEPSVEDRGDKHESLRDTLRIKGEIIKELKVRVLKSEIHSSRGEWESRGQEEENSSSPVIQIDLSR